MTGTDTPAAPGVTEVAADLLAEQNALDALVAELNESQWSTPTPSPRWSVRDQVAHLAYFDRTASLAIVDEAAFKNSVTALTPALRGDPESGDDLTLGSYRAMTPSEFMDAWRADRAALADAAATLADDTRVIWYGPSMGARSFLTARLMECWAHGQDVVDTLGLERPASDRLRHIAQLGFITRGWTYRNRGLDVPEEPVRVELTAPSGATWRYGPDDASEHVTGSALDFCLVVTQRRHVDDTDLTTTPFARDWLLKAQAFAGPPSDGPKPTED